MPKVSVICTVRNGISTLGMTIQSIRDQTMSDWEFIIVDDGSTDGSVDLVHEYAKDDARIRLIETKGVGRGKALNLAINVSRSEYVANIDADDPSHPERLRLQASLLDSNRGITVLGARTIVVIGTQSSPEWDRLSCEVPSITDVTRTLALYNPLNHSSVMMRREALSAVGGYDETRTSQFDYDMWVRLAAKGCRLGIVEAVLAAKRLHDMQSFETRKRLRYLATSAQIQVSAIRCLHVGVIPWFYLGARLVWGLFPRPLRLGFRRLLAMI